MSLATIARRALVVDRIRPNWARGAGLTVLVSAPLVAALIADRLDIGLLATLGALNVGLADPGGVRRIRARATIAASVAMTVAIALSTLVAGTPWLAVAALALWTLVMALAGSLGPGAPGVAFVASVIFIVGLGLPEDPSEVVFRSVAFAVGCAWTVLMTVAVWPFRPDDTARTELASGFELMARFLREAPHGERERVARRAAIADALRAAREAMARGNATSNRATATVSMFAAADVIERGLGAIDRALASAGPAGVPVELAEGIEALAATCDDLAGSIGDRWSADSLAVSVRRLEPVELEGDAAIARDALALVSSGLAEPSRPPVRTTERGPDGLRQRVRVLANRDSIVFRHAVRLASVVGVAQVVAFFDSFGNSYWIPLTVVVVLKPDLGSTIDRAVQRTIGTVLGALLAFAAVSIADGRTWVLVIAFAAFVFWTLSAIEASYALGVVGLTPSVIVLLAIDGGGDALVVNRLVATLVGGALALLGAFLLWPLWARRTLAGELATAATTTDRYLADAVDPSAETDDVRDAHRRAELASSDAEALQRRMLSEPSRDRIAPTDVISYCTALHALIESTSQLRATWRAHDSAPGPGSPSSLGEALEPSHRRLQAIADGFGAPPAATDPAQSSSQLHVRLAVDGADRLLVTRIDALTTSMAHSAGRISAELARR